MGRWLGRTVAVVAGCFAALIIFAGAAFAHVEVSADPPVEGATDAVVTFSAEAESPTSGVVSVRIVLPEGLTSNDVTLNKAPDGWKLTPAADGYTVAGPALPTGQAAVHSIIVTHLPDMPSLTFKAIVTYADGSADHWIDDKTAANPNPPHPAPVLQLAASSASVSATNAARAPNTATAAGPTASGDGTSGSFPWWIVVVAVLVALVVGLLVARGRRASTDRGPNGTGS
jgi:Domain of unkown function (DUF1775)